MITPHNSYYIHGHKYRPITWIAQIICPKYYKNPHYYILNQGELIRIHGAMKRLPPDVKYTK
jgi:hypothetical protein